ncbi:MAG: hypothetical protein K0S20_299 [Patescibacteria group bacterium]|nr:hypothetical protein [Patescibacteria group bacterium]
MNFFNIVSGYVLYPAVFLLITLFGIVLLKSWGDYNSPYNDDEEICKKGNVAIAAQRIGVYLGFTLAITGSMQRTREGFLIDLRYYVFDGILALIIFALCMKLSDAYILRNVRNCEELGRGNKAVGIVEMGAYIATGLMLNGTFSGDSPSLVNSIVSILLFATLGQLALFGLYSLIELRTPYNVDEEIKSGNTACAIIVAGELVALGIILRNSIAGPFVGWFRDVSAFGMSLLAGLILLWIARIVGDRIFLMRTSLASRGACTQEVAPGLIMASVSIVLAIVVAAVA